jgi:geranylgeranylglycerol-phosphate geranylgeranyltransferase
MDIRELAKLTRFEHALMLAFAVLIGETIVLGSLPPLSLVIALSLLVPVFSEMGSFALNDYLDIETDRLNKKLERPLVKGTIPPTFALYFSIISLILSTVMAFFINTVAFGIALAFNLLAVAYSWKLKDFMLMGNIYIALTMAIPFIFGNFVVSGTLSMLAVVLALLGFIAGLAREIVKSVQDMEGDVKARSSKTLPVVIGTKGSLAVAVLLYLAFIPLSISPFLLGLRVSALPVILVAGADLTILVLCYMIVARQDFRFARNASLVSFALGMVGLFLASF